MSASENQFSLTRAASATYQITRIDGNEKLEMSGEELMPKGLFVAIGERPGVAIIKYQRMP